jgi:hypothetical protein
MVRLPELTHPFRQSRIAHSSKEKIRFQLFLMLMTIQPFFLASAISESGKVPIFDFGP